MAKSHSPPGDAWLKMYPAEQAILAVRFLRDTWVEVTKASPAYFTESMKEPILTERLWSYLENRSISIGRLTGQWSYERQIIEFGLDGSKIARIRKDITYFSDKAGRLDLTFEFKKLTNKANSRNHYQGESGMRRFVDGHYAKKQPFALMVGMISGDLNGCVSALRTSLLKADTRKVLQLLPDEAGFYIREPSKLCESVAQFDTEHTRPVDRGPAHGSILLAHLFLEFPEA